MVKPALQNSARWPLRGWAPPRCLPRWVRSPEPMEDPWRTPGEPPENPGKMTKDLRMVGKPWRKCWSNKIHMVQICVSAYSETFLAFDSVLLMTSAALGVKHGWTMDTIPTGQVEGWSSSFLAWHVGPVAYGSFMKPLLRCKPAIRPINQNWMSFPTLLIWMLLISLDWHHPSLNS